MAEAGPASSDPDMAIIRSVPQDLRIIALMHAAVTARTGPRLIVPCLNFLFFGELCVNLAVNYSFQKLSGWKQHE